MGRPASTTRTCTRPSLPSSSPSFLQPSENKESSFRQRRRASRTAERQEAALAATRTKAAKADKQQVENSDIIQTIEKETMLEKL